MKESERNRKQRRQDYGVLTESAPQQHALADGAAAAAAAAQRNLKLVALS